MSVNAISSNGKVLFIKDNKVVGEGKHYISVGDKVGVVVTSGELHDYLSNHPEMETFKNSPALRDLKDFCIYFSEVTGGYLELKFEDCSEIDEYFEDISCVSEFEFRWGMVPDIYKDVPGFRSAIEQD